MPGSAGHIASDQVLTRADFRREQGFPGDRPRMRECAPMKTESGLEYTDDVVGAGAQPKRGDTVVVHYSGYLDDGTKFDSSLDRKSPFEFTLGVGQVIKGWDEGVASMRIGGKRKLLIPAELGYGKRGAGGVIPPNARLTFDVELLGIR